MAGGTMERPIVTVLDIWDNLVPCMWMLRIVHVQDLHNHLIEDLGLANSLGVEPNGFCELVVQQRPETRPKGVEEVVVSVGDDGLWYSKVNPNTFDEYLGRI
jgi:hypothetical protein